MEYFVLTRGLSFNRTAKYGARRPSSWIRFPMPSVSSSPPLPQAVGYAVVLGLGFFFALAMNLTTWIQARFSQYSPNSASEFSAASRSLKTGLVVAGIISACERWKSTTWKKLMTILLIRDMELNPVTECNSVIRYGHFWWMVVRLTFPNLHIMILKHGWPGMRSVVVYK